MNLHSWLVSKRMTIFIPVEMTLMLIQNVEWQHEYFMAETNWPVLNKAKLGYLIFLTISKQR